VSLAFLVGPQTTHHTRAQPPRSRDPYLVAFPRGTPDVVGGSSCLIHVQRKSGVPDSLPLKLPGRVAGGGRGARLGADAGRVPSVPQGLEEREGRLPAAGFWEAARSGMVKSAVQSPRSCLDPGASPGRRHRLRGRAAQCRLPRKQSRTFQPEARANPRGAPGRSGKGCAEWGQRGPDASCAAQAAGKPRTPGAARPQSHPGTAGRATPRGAQGRHPAPASGFPHPPLPQKLLLEPQSVRIRHGPPPWGLIKNSERQSPLQPASQVQSPNLRMVGRWHARLYQEPQHRQGRKVEGAERSWDCTRGSLTQSLQASAEGPGQRSNWEAPCE
jgi:hypothetical protein